MKATQCLLLGALLAVVSGISAASQHHPAYSPTPQGYMLSSCLHSVPSGSFIQPHEDNSLAVFIDGALHSTIPSCDTSKLPLFERDLPKLLSKNPFPAEYVHRATDPFPADYDGWTAYTAFNISGNFEAFLGYFSVPDSPQNYPDILYLFTGLQNFDWIPKIDPNPGNFDIIQPVLQYPADSGSGWSLKSWYVTLNAGALYSEELLINSGDLVFGNMTRVNGTAWFINSVAASTGQGTSLTVDAKRLAQQKWAYNTLECYGCEDCSTYPQKPVLFSKLKLVETNGKAVAPQWKINPKNQPKKFCGELPILNKDGSVSIRFQKP
jgi:hypothetical protein